MFLSNQGVYFYLLMPGIVYWSMENAKASDPAAVSIERFIQNPVQFVPTILSARNVRTCIRSAYFGGRGT